MLDTKAIKEILDKLLSENDKVFIVPHNRPDMDALGSSIGMYLICKKLKKDAYIVIDDDLNKIEKSTKKVIEEITNEYQIVDLEEAKELINDKSLLITVDVNKKHMVSVGEILKKFKEIVVIDHHKIDENSIKTKNLFTSDKLSSTCEEISRLLFAYNVKITPQEANYLLAGIILDTNKLSKNVSFETYNVASKLASKGADATIANNMFLEDFEHDRMIQKLVDNTCFPSFVYAIASDKEDNLRIYEAEDIAKAADYLLRYNVNATFAIAHTDEGTISISARSKGIIDVSRIMKLFGGGGNEYSAAAKVQGMSIEDVKNKLNMILIPTTIMEEVEIKKEENQLKLAKKELK